MDHKELYEQVMLKLKNNERPLIKLTPELILELKTKWQKAIEQTKIDDTAIRKIICILDNTQNMTSEFNDLFIITLDKVRDQNLLIFILGASQKHVIGESLRTGNMISQQYFEKLKELLKNKNPEVVEWTLRTIESMGPLSLRFAKEVRNVNLGLFSFLNKHHKSSSQIISLLEEQWGKMKS